MRTKRQTAETWDEIASQHGAYRRKSWPAVADFLKESQGAPSASMQNNAPILDIGCGGASYLRKQDVGVDISFEMCKLANKMRAVAFPPTLQRKSKIFLAKKTLCVFSGCAAKQNGNSASLSGKGCSVCADAVFLPIRSGKFAKILSVATLHHLPTRENRLAFLREVKRVLKPNGRALITCWYRWQARHLPRAIFTQNVHKKWGRASRYLPAGKSAKSPILRYYHLFSKRELAKLARQVFDDFEIKIEKGTKYKNLYLYVYK